MVRARLLCTPMILLFLVVASCGTLGNTDNDQLALKIRGEYLAAQMCQGTMSVTADYGQRVYNYKMTFQWEPRGDLILTVTEPENLAGITARVSQGKSMLEYDGVRLETGSLAQNVASPIDGFPLLLTDIREGYIAECGAEMLGQQQALRICCRDPNQMPGQGIEGVIWFDWETHAMLRGELRSDGNTIVSFDLDTFSMS